jgi:hypothetical protein
VRTGCFQSPSGHFNPVSGLRFQATTTLKRSDFGLGAYVPQVIDEISLQLTSQGVEAKGYAEYLKKEKEKKQLSPSRKDAKKNSELVNSIRRCNTI